MKIIGLNNSSHKLAQNTDIGQQQMQATNAAISFLKGKIPEMVPMLTNPTTRNFLIRFFDMIASDPSVLAGFRNALQTISTSMQRDAAGTTTAITSTK